MKHPLITNLSLACVISCVPACKRQSEQKVTTEHSPVTETDSDPFERKADTSEQSKSQPRYYETEELADIVLFPATDAPKAGLEVEILEPVVWTSNYHATFTYRITNYLDDEVFVQVQDLHVVGTNYKGPEGFAGGGIGSGVEWPGNRILLKRLESGGCGCSIAEVKASTEVPYFASDKGKTTVKFFVTGFYRSNGKQFIEWIELPFPLKKNIPFPPNRVPGSD